MLKFNIRITTVRSSMATVDLLNQ